MLSVKKLPWGASLRIPRRLMRQAQIAETFPQSCRRGICLRRKRQSSRKRFLQWRQPRRNRLGFPQKRKLHSKKKVIPWRSERKSRNCTKRRRNFLRQQRICIQICPHLRRMVLRPMERIGALKSRSRKKPLQNLRRMNTWQQITPKRLMRRMKRASARSSTSWTSMNWIGG